MPHSPTPIRKLRASEVVRSKCYICDESGRHEFWDPESNGSICKLCLSHTLNAEELLTGIEGITRPTFLEKVTKDTKSSKKDKS